MTHRFMSRKSKANDKLLKVVSEKNRCPEHVSTIWKSAPASSICAMRGTERYMKMHMKHEHGDAHLCVCVWGG